jgi:DNA-binding LacI/PurR family transcriptional regulator
MTGARPTQADIARTVGIDAAQVSRALRGGAGVSAAVRERVIAVSAELGYRIDPATSGLAESRWAGRRRPAQGIALLIPHGARHASWLRDNPRMMAFQACCCAQASAAGYRFRVVRLCDFASSQALQKDLDRHAIGGIVIAFHPDPVQLELRWSDLSTVLIGDGMNLHGHHRIMTDYQQTVALAAGHARRSGCRRIGFACLRYGNRSLEDAITAQMLLQRERLAEFGLASLELFRFAADDAPRACRDWYEREQPDCIIASHNQPYHWLAATGVRFPRACSFIGLLGKGRRGDPDLTCVDRRHQALAEQAVATLDRAMRSGSRGPVPFPITSLVPGAWRHGSTLRAPVAARRS